ncbi:tetratricopeptide repeat protein [Streptomyces sp. NEAU-W12]|uniref:tetratricopeptide repeat protein n=1 Tax=Streptomyces sp. NEAU-W12 TaxID=2994668 RepID=UPI00224B8108|nr:tetratricopeptide repeat protein [Streptomyces sp. NEAU-W12]MCX2922100.1 tetratricopeptide repeat protein [Streptomyces sp. NEAU-W12]
MPAPQYGRAAALSSAMAACAADQESPAWRELTHAVRAAVRADRARGRNAAPASDQTVALLWSLVAPPGAEPDAAPTALQRLAARLDDLASRDPDTERALTDWLRRHPPAPADSGPTNVIGGTAVLHGPSVQARDIHGGLHIHQTPGPAAAARQPLPVPRQLPPSNRHFLDREDDRRALDDLLARRSPHASPLVVVSGFAGVGKTALVSRWLHQHESRFPDGHLYADLGGHADDGGPGPVAPATVLEGFLVALGARSIPATTAQRSVLWRSVTSGLRLAVFLDNAFTAAQVRPLLLGSPAGLTVVTARSHLTGLRVDGAAVHHLAPLPAESAVELLALGGGRRVAHEPAAARDVVALCGRLPLAVALASAQLAVRPHRSVSALAESLARGGGPLDALHIEGEPVMRTALDASYDLLPDDGATLYRRMGLLPTDRYDHFMLSAVAGHATTGGTGAPAGVAVDLAIDALLEASLLEETGPGTYRFHDLVRPHARRLGEEEEAKEGSTGRRGHTLRRFVDWCLATATLAEGMLTPSHRMTHPDGAPAAEPTVAPTPLAGPEEALAWLDTHRGSLMGAVQHCARVGWDTTCWQLTDRAWPLFLRLRPSEMWIEAHRLGLDAARRSGSRQGEGRMLTSGAIGLRDAGQYDEAAAWYRQALGHATADGDVRQQAQAVNGLGHIGLLTGRLDEAHAHFEHALRLRESIGYRRGAALSRMRLGETALAGNDFGAAAEHLRQAYTELESLAEDYEATRALALLGHVLVEDNDQGEGTRRLREALARFRAGGTRSRHWEGRSLEWLGRAAESRGDTEEAGLCYEAARDLFQRVNPVDAERVEARLRHL